MSFWKELYLNCPPAEGPLFGRKANGLAERNAEAKKLTSLMCAQNSFCFLRMGDLESMLLLSLQYGRFEDFAEKSFSDRPLGGTVVEGNPGLGRRHLERLKAAYEGADYVDFHEGNWPNEHLVKLLQLNRAAGAHRNPDKRSSLVFLAWLENEFRDYCKGRRVGFVGAEALLLKSLSKRKEFLDASWQFWPAGEHFFFLQPRDNGAKLDANLNLVKEDVRNFVSTNAIDTVFISLGGGAKIISYELSREMGVRFFDFGSLTRALTYSGCDGNNFARSPHYPYLYRLPFDLYMDSLEEVLPGLSPEKMLAKAHGQLIQELIKKEPGWSHASMEYDFCRENVVAFRQALGRYHIRYRHIFHASKPAKLERAAFLHFCGTHRLSLEGVLFMILFWAKVWVNKYFFLKK